MTEGVAPSEETLHGQEARPERHWALVALLPPVIAALARAAAPLVVASLAPWLSIELWRWREASRALSEVRRSDATRGASFGHAQAHSFMRRLEALADDRGRRGFGLVVEAVGDLDRALEALGLPAATPPAGPPPPLSPALAPSSSPFLVGIPTRRAAEALALRAGSGGVPVRVVAAPLPRRWLLPLYFTTSGGAFALAAVALGMKSAAVLGMVAHEAFVEAVLPWAQRLGRWAAAPHQVEGAVAAALAAAASERALAAAVGDLVRTRRLGGRSAVLANDGGPPARPGG